jgi:hypothetical protein
MRNNRWMAPALILACLAVPRVLAGPPQAAEAARPARLEPIPGSDLKRVILSPKAAERIAITTATVRQEQVIRWLVVEGKVEAVPADSAVKAARAPVPVAANFVTHVLVHVSNILRGVQDSPPRLEEHAKLGGTPKADDDDDDDEDAKPSGQANDQQAVRRDRTPVVVPMGTHRSAVRLPARPVRVAAAGDIAATAPDDIGAEYYEVTASDHGLRPGQDVYVRLPHPDNGTSRNVVPYSAVIYDSSGNTWVYTNPEPQVFVRQRIEVEFIQGPRAILKNGPADGTVVVAIGSALLFGVEQKFGQ